MSWPGGPISRNMGKVFKIHFSQWQLVNIFIQKNSLVFHSFFYELVNTGTQWKTGNPTVVKDLRIYESTDLDNIQFSRIHLLIETNVNCGDIKLNFMTYWSTWTKYFKDVYFVAVSKIYSGYLLHFAVSELSIMVGKNLG